MNKYKGTLVLSLSPDRIPLGSLDKIKAMAEGREIVVGTDAAEIEKIIDRVEIVAGDIPFAFLPRAPHLAWVQLWSAGADIIQKIPELKQMSFVLTTTSGMHGPQITEHLFGLLLSYIRRFHLAFVAQKKHEWYRPDSRDLIRLGGKKMLILGYGSIGKHAALAAKAFGMNVTGLRRNPPAGGQDETGTTVKSSALLMDLLPDADFVVNILPLTPETMNSVGKEFFRGMKSSAVYINVGRGMSTDEDALIHALKTKQIAGALLDVTREEPLSKDSPLWDMDNVLISGHYAGVTPDYDIQGMGIFLENLDAYVQGKQLVNVVDKQKGY